MLILRTVELAIVEKILLHSAVWLILNHTVSSVLLLHLFYLLGSRLYPLLSYSDVLCFFLLPLEDPFQTCEAEPGSFHRNQIVYSTKLKVEESLHQYRKLDR